MVQLHNFVTNLGRDASQAKLRQMQGPSSTDPGVSGTCGSKHSCETPPNAAILIPSRNIPN